mmetsp:Transcript_25491/g.28316  ORF Transcript_25491/g.28316 Transcript_25491/m.28316 type:complete len:109 (-) Transcript_25491:51-377(-)
MLEKGIDQIEIEASEKSAFLYDLIDSSDGYYINNVDHKYRSRLNVIFRVKEDEELENKFVEEAALQGLKSIKGHKTIGGIRVSIYNAMPMEGVIKMAEFMKKFVNDNP